MSYSYTQTGSQTFTVTYARYLASKVATDLMRIHRLYGSPTESRIQQFETELTELLRNGYVDNVTYGFQKNGNWIEPTIRYTARELSALSNADDDPGKIRPGADVSGALFTSYLSYSASFTALTLDQQEAFENTLPFQRSGSPTPGVTGYLQDDKSYSSGGRSLNRSSVKIY
jgi:hypothetical protein